MPMELRRSISGTTPIFSGLGADVDEVRVRSLGGRSASSVTSSLLAPVLALERGLRELPDGRVLLLRWRSRSLSLSLSRSRSLLLGLRRSPSDSFLRRRDESDALSMV